MSYRQRVLSIVLLGALLLSMSLIRPAIAHDRRDLSANLLINGDFEQLPFYGPLRPNHYVAGGWYRWWVHGTILPEFDDVKGDRVGKQFDGDHAQIYHKWGATYTAGIYQVVDGLMPCRPYRLTMHVQNRSLPGVHPHARIGLDPYGADLTTGDSLDDRGAVLDTAPLDRAVWSREQEALFQWEELAVSAEPRGDKLTAILYASPVRSSSDAPHYYDTYWDAGALIQTTYESGRLPAPTQPTTGFIHNVSYGTNAGLLNIRWDLSEPATTQVWYGVAAPSIVSPTIISSHTVYLPMISRFTLNYPNATQLHFYAEGTQTETIRDVASGQIISWIVLARRLAGDVCVTEYAGPYRVQMPDSLP